MSPHNRTHAPRARAELHPLADLDAPMPSKNFVSRTLAHSHRHDRGPTRRSFDAPPHVPGREGLDRPCKPQSKSP